jgi:putative hydrolase of the HAD superfamily
MLKNIIFDFGGVIIPVDPMAYAAGMTELGCKDVLGLHKLFLREQVYTRFEKGKMSPDEFRKMLRTGVGHHVTDDQLDKVWNLILGEIPAHRVRFLEKIKSNYHTFLLSNTNQIHYDRFQEQFCRSYGYASLDDLFEKTYYSFRLHLEKPDPAIFEFVLKDSGLIPEETLFIDDNEVNIETAKNCGMQTIHLEYGKEITEIFPPDHLTPRPPDPLTT